MAKIIKVIDAVSDRSGEISAWLILPATLVIVYEIVSRYVFNAPTLWAHGVAMRIFGVYFVIGGAYAILHKAHIRVDVVYQRFPVRVRGFIDVLISGPFLFLTIFVCLWFGSRYFWKSLMLLENCGTPFHAPIYPIKFFIPFAAFLMLLQGFVFLYRRLKTGLTGEDIE